ncbi:MAG TPA: FAD-dependent oxidoreductase, partial [Opitutus sp.]|nr:FAD-dependent oxidoreductase [Opitutus sp.]
MAPRRFVLLIEPDAAKLASRREALASSVSETLTIEGVTSFAAAEAFVTEVRERGQELALVVASEDGDADVREQFFRRMQVAFPDARLMVVAGDPAGVDTCANRTEDADAPLAPLVHELLTIRLAAVATVEMIGDRWSPRAHQLKDFLCRHRVPYRWIDVEGDRREAHTRNVEEIPSDALPLLVFSDGSDLKNPTNDEVARKLGFDTKAAEKYYDLVIVGGGPAGLAAAVYAASEGVSTLILERHAAGGQAGTSTLIENYLGFPEGLSGAELAERAVAQAQRFGTEILITKEAVALREDGNLRCVTMHDGSTVSARSVVIATGVRYTKLNAPGADRLHGAGIYYGAAAAEAARYGGEEVCLLGGGNSAGQ